MEEDEIAKRIRQVRDIEIAMDESGEGRTPYSDAIRNAVPYMTPEEIRYQLLRTLDKLDALSADKAAAQEQSKKELEAMSIELAAAREAIADKDRAMAEKDRQISDRDRMLSEKDAEISSLKESLAKKESENTDANHKVSSMNTDKFRGTSKRGIDKDRTTAKGRDDDRDDFDGTESSASPDESSSQKGVVVKDLCEIKKGQSAQRGTYTLADAKVVVSHDCDESLLPEGAVITGRSVETVFDEVHIIRAHVYGMVTYRIKEAYVDEDGNAAEKWVVHTKHFSRAKEDGAAPDGTEIRKGQVVEYASGHTPGQVPGTKVTRRMLALLILQHLDAHVPVNRLSRIFGEFGFSVGRSTLVGWLKTGADMLEKAYSKLLDKVLADNAITYCDETWERLHLKDITRKVYTWIIGNRLAKAVAYVYDDGSRGRKVLKDLLEGRSIKAMHTDGYTAYYYLRELGIAHLCCNAHVWRKIKEWYELTGDPDALCLLLALQWLYTQEAGLKERNAPPDEVLRFRNSERTAQELAKFEARLELLATKIDTLPKKGRTAVNYALSLLPKLFRWREDPDYELDNNFAERAARPVALSRKTSYFNCSHYGAKMRAVMRSFTETCKLQGVGIINYLTGYFAKVCSGRDDYENMLPGTLSIAR